MEYYISLRVHRKKSGLNRSLKTQKRMKINFNARTVRFVHSTHFFFNSFLFNHQLFGIENWCKLGIMPNLLPTFPKYFQTPKINF